MGTVVVYVEYLTGAKSRRVLRRVMRRVPRRIGRVIEGNVCNGVRYLRVSEGY